MAECFDCKRPYGSGGFPDLVIPYWAWKQISPTGDDGGLLCPSCICERLHISGISCEGAFMSGPINSVSRPTMNTLRRGENIELAIEGRDNAWSGEGGPMSILEKCPACGAACEAYHPESETDYEWWGFACEAEIIREHGRFFVEEGCEAALRNAVAKLNAARAATVSTQEGS